MIEIPLAVVTELFNGVVSVEESGRAVTPLRLARRAWTQVPDDLTREVFRNTSGVRLEAVTRASALELDVYVTLVKAVGSEASEERAVFDLCVDGAVFAHATAASVGNCTFDLEGRLLAETQVQTTLQFLDLPSEEKTLELWFPPNASVTVRAVRANEELRRAEPDRPRWVHYGSSISQCAGASSPTQTWPAIVARAASVELLNLGVRGNCHLDQFVARMISDAPADFISIKIGINIAGTDSLKHRTFAPALHGFLDTVRDGHPRTPLLVVSPIVCPELEATPGPSRAIESGTGTTCTCRCQPRPGSLSLQKIRGILEEAVRARSAADDALFYTNGLRLFGTDDLVELPDGVHPSPHGYTLIAERFLDVASERGFLEHTR